MEHRFKNQRSEAMFSLVADVNFEKLAVLPSSRERLNSRWNHDADYRKELLGEKGLSFRDFVWSLIWKCSFIKVTRIFSGFCIIFNQFFTYKYIPLCFGFYDRRHRWPFHHTAGWLAGWLLAIRRVSMPRFEPRPRFASHQLAADYVTV